VLALACALAGAAPAGLAQAQVLPSGANVVSGQASIATHGNQMTVHNSANAVLNWQSFSIGAGQSVRFEQPSASSQVLNRVLGRDASHIAGSLSSNGGVWLLNPYGVMFGPEARIDVAGLVASTLNISDADWQARRYALFGGGAQAGAVVNQGEIRTTLGGQVLLLGGSGGVRNEGLIDAPGGQVMLAAGASVDLADSQTPGLAVRVTAPAGEALNLGQVLAAGGRIDLQAAMVNQHGIVRADSLAQGPGGQVVLQGGTTLVSGVVSADGTQGRGGQVHLLGQQVGLLAGADVSASGRDGGGQVLVGGGLQGQDTSVPNARAVYMDPGASVRADATGNGDGGLIVLWSDQATRAYGSLSARGGALGGNGGFIETSGGWLDARPLSIRTDAPLGLAGQWLLDPNDILISAGSDTHVTPAPSFTSTDDSAVVSLSSIIAALDAGNNVTITTGSGGSDSQPGNITMSGSLVVDPPTAVTLTLNAARHIDLLGSYIEATDAPLHLTLNAGTAGEGAIRLSSTTILTNGNITLGGASQACGAAGCSPFAAATGTSEASRGTGVSIDNSTLVGGRITIRGASAVENQLIAGVSIDYYSSLGAGHIDIAGWVGSSAGHDQIGVLLLGELQAVNTMSIDGSALVSGPGSSVYSLGVALSGYGSVHVGPSVTSVFPLSCVDCGPANTRLSELRPDRRTLAADPNRWLRITGYADTGSNYTSSAVSLGGWVEVADKAGVNIRGDGGSTFVGGSMSIADAGHLLVSGDSQLTIGSDFQLPSAEPTRLTNSLGIEVTGSLTGAPSELLIDAAGGDVLIGYPFWPVVIDVGTAPLTLRGNSVHVGSGVAATTLTAGQVLVQGSEVYFSSNALINSSASGNAITVAGLSGNADIFIVDSGGSPLSAPNGRWLVYATSPVDPAAFDPGSLNHDFVQYGATFGSTNPLGSGDGLLFSISPTLSVSGTVVGSTTKVYDGNTSIAATVESLEVTGLLGGDILYSNPVFGSLSYSSANAGTGIPLLMTLLGGAPVVTDDSARPVYGYSYGTDPSLTGTIQPRPLTVDIQGSLDKVYDGTRDAYLTGASLSGLVGGQSLTVLPGTLLFDTADAGTDKPVTGTITLADGPGGLAQNYTIAAGGTVQTTAAITPKPIAFVGATVADKVYDGNTAATLLGGTLSGLVGNQTLSLSTSAVAFDTKDAGTGKTVTGTLVLADGGQGGRAANYQLDGSPDLVLTGNILPRPVNFSSLLAADKIYDGNTLAAITVGSLLGLVDGESLAFDIEGRFNDAHAGVAKPVSVNVTLLDGATGAAGNYTVAGTGLQTTASVLPRPVTLTGLQAVDKVYDGTRDAGLTQVQFAGLVEGESLQVRPGSLQFDTADVGSNKPVSGQVDLIDGPGGLARNYSLVDSGPVATSGSISPRPISFAGASIADKVYDGTRDATLVGGSLVGLVPGQTLTVSAQASFDTKDAGVDKPVTATVLLADGAQGGRVGNYTLTSGPALSLTGTIQPRLLQLSGTGVSDKVYDGSTLASVAVGGLQGLLAGESLQFQAEGHFDSSQVGNGRTVLARVTLLDGPGGLAANYRVLDGGFQATASILPRPLTVLGVFVADKPYDGTLSATLTAQTFEGLVPGETLTLASLASFATPGVGSGKPVTGSIALADGNAAASNYTLTNPGQFSGTGTIVPRGLTVTGASAADKVYDGSLTAAVSNFSLTGMLPGEQVSVTAGSGLFVDPNVGSNKGVTATATALGGADAANYMLASPSVQTSASISPATLVYVADRIDAAFNHPLPWLTGTIAGLVPGDTVDSATTGALLFTTTAAQGSPLGLYPVQGQGLSALNYLFTQSPDNLTALAIVPVSTSKLGEETSTVPTVPTLLTALLPPPVVSTVSAHRVLDALPTLQVLPSATPTPQSASPTMGFRALDLDSTSQQDLASMLAARDRYKKSLFADAIRELEKNPGAADAPACQTVEQAAAGNCLITEALKPALRERTRIEMQLPAVPAPAPPPPPVAVPPLIAAVPAPAPTTPVAPAAGPAPAPAPVPAPTAPIAPAAPPAVAVAAPEAPFRLPVARAVRTASLPQIQRKWALLIGTDVYQDTRIPQLDNAVADVDAVAKVLEDRLGYQTLVVRNGSKAAILKAFNQLAAAVDPSDSVAIYYAGHGELVEKLGLGFWQPADADASRPETWISNTDIGKLLGQLGASQVVLVSDSCFSGSLVSDERIRAGGAAPDAAALLSRRAAVVMSSGGNEPVFDSGKNGHSAFAWSLMRTLEGVASWRPGSNVFEQVRFAVARQVPQRPQYGASRLGGHQAGADYVFEQRQLDTQSK
jgi:filamentous hemagglutinin family protein